MTTRTRALRNLAGYAAGFVPSVLIGVIAMLAVVSRARCSAQLG
ncbi:hypothetical protein [Arthrobacter sp. FB24]|nr:hypothetical protein [Arthrobacter sp. FB24]